VAALGAVARHDDDARAVLISLADGAPERLRHEVALALSMVALRQSAETMAWLAGSRDDVRTLAIELLRDGFEALEEDFAEEQFFAAARAAYWKAGEGSTARTVVATLVDKLEF
jgi:hypothetical protein